MFCYKFSQLLSRKQDILGLFLAHPIGVRGGLQLVARFWVRPAGPYHFVSLPACPGPSLDHSSRHECGRSAEAAFSIPLSSTPIFSLLFLSSNALFLGRDRKIFFTNFPRLTWNFKLLSRFIPIIYIPYYICHPIKKLLHLWSINSLLVKVVEIENNIFFSWRALLINSS